MKTLIGTLLALGLLSTSASAWYCPPGSGYSQPSSTSYGRHRPTYGHAHMPRMIERPAAPADMAPPAPIEPPAAQPEPVPQK